MILDIIFSFAGAEKEATHPRTAIRNVVHNDDTVRSAIVCSRYCTESFLTW